MSAEFEVTITDKDMFRFNLYHAYHGFQGIIATLVGIWVLAMAGLTFGQVVLTINHLQERAERLKTLVSRFRI